MHKLLNHQNISTYGDEGTQKINKPEIDLANLRSMAPWRDVITNVVASNLNGSYLGQTSNVCGYKSSESPNEDE